MIVVIVALHLFPITRTHLLLMRDGIDNIFSREMTYMKFTHGRWSPQYLLLRDATVALLLFHIIRTQHLFMREGVHDIYS